MKANASFKMPKFVLLLVFMAGLSACTTSIGREGKPMPVLTFENLQPLAINVRSMNVQSGEPRTYQNFVVSPSFALENYLQQRFTAQGMNDALRVIVEDASVEIGHQDSDKGVARYMGVAGFDVFDVNIKLRLEHVDHTGHIFYGTTLSARRVIKVSEHASITEREKHQLEGMEEMFRQLDDGVQKIVLQDMRLGL